jgi:RNA polymerase sigma-70 factor (ECF subfamily)
MQGKQAKTSPQDPDAVDGQQSRSPSAPASDSALLHRIAARDEHALALLYDRWSEQVFARALQLLGDEDEAEDVTEETFWKAWRYAKRFARSKGTVGTWLLVIARRLALDRLRTRQRQREERRERLPEPSFESSLTPTTTSPLQDVEAAERCDLVARALKELPPEQQTVMEMSFFQGMSQSEIAEHTSQPLGTVKTRVRLAMQKLREQLGWLRGEST